MSFLKQFVFKFEFYDCIWVELPWNDEFPACFLFKEAFYMIEFFVDFGN